MRDLYKLAGLLPFESSTSEIKRKVQQRPGGWEDAEHVLLHSGRKQIYDRTHANLAMIGKIRADLKLGSNGFWSEQDLSAYNFVRKQSNAASAAPKGKSYSSNKSKGVKPPLSFRTIFNTAIILGVALFYYYVVFEPAQRHGIPTEKAAEQIGNRKSADSSSFKMYVTSESLNVRSKPNNTSPILGKLDKFATVKVYPKKKEGLWNAIIYNGRIAYVHENYLKRGSGYHVRLRECEKLGVSRPKHGTVWSSIARKGQHSVEIKSQSGPDSIVKLKKSSGETLVTAYVYGGGSFTISRIPSGTYYFQYATGKDFSPSCKTFVRNLQASGDPNPILFKQNQPAIMSYTLYRVSGGNFNPQSVANESF